MLLQRSLMLSFLFLCETVCLCVFVCLLPFCCSLHGLGRLNVSHLTMLRKVKFYKHLFLSANSVLCNVFHFTLIHNFYGDAMLRTVFIMPLYLAVELVFQSFADYVG